MGADYTDVGYKHNRVYCNTSVRFRQGRFEMPRGMLVVPRTEDTADDGLTVFEGPVAVPLRILA
jgi:hypothetical protein